jgi:hypothetical protein
MIGYITTFKTTTLINHTNLRGGNQVSTGEIVRPRIIVGPSFAKINYDGQLDSPIEPGVLTQTIVATSGGKTLFDGLQLNGLAESGLITVTDLDLGLHYADGVMVALTDNTPIPISNRDFMIIDVRFEILSFWRSTP